MPAPRTDRRHQTLGALKSVGYHNDNGLNTR